MKILNKIVNIVLILIIFICIYNISEKLIEYNKADNSYEKIRVEKEEENLYDKYEDYRGWIKIDNTNINYPIVQGKDNSFYLDKDINKNYLSSGSIFMNYLNHGFNDENTVLFGHQFLEDIKNKSLYKSDIDVNENDKIITLSTCSYEFNDARMVVHGKLLK